MRPRSPHPPRRGEQTDDVTSVGRMRNSFNDQPLQTPGTGIVPALVKGFLMLIGGLLETLVSNNSHHHSNDDSTALTNYTSQGATLQEKQHVDCSGGHGDAGGGGGGDGNGGGGDGSSGDGCGGDDGAACGSGSPSGALTPRTTLQPLLLFCWLSAMQPVPATGRVLNVPMKTW